MRTMKLQPKMMVLLAAMLVSPAASGRPAPLQTVVRGNNQFAFDLYAQIGKDTKDKNLFFSPYSISTALAMTYAGARGETAAQMAKVLHLTLKNRRLHAAFNALLSATRRSTKGSGNTLTVANALWGQRGYKFLEGFLSLILASYGAGLREVDFKRNSEGARRTINQWVEKETKKKIRDLIPKGVLKPLTRLVLTNAIYFRGTWAVQFDKKSTVDQDFYLAGGGKVKVPLMHVTLKRAGYLEGKGFQALELPYRGKKISMVVLLPKKGKGLSALEGKLGAGWLEGKLRSLRATKVKVYLPRFKNDAAFQLGKQLKQMGMPLPFSSRADFTGMTAKPDLRISKVLHKAFVDVNEEGTEAAAATAVIMKRKAPMAPVPVFRADRPFVYLIRDRTTGSILFLGRMLNPRR